MVQALELLKHVLEFSKSFSLFLFTFLNAKIPSNFLIKPIKVTVKLSLMIWHFNEKNYIETRLKRLSVFKGCVLLIYWEFAILLLMC